MFGIQDLWLFVLSGFLLNVTPGPDMALVVARSATRGVKAGIAAALGVGVGALVHIVAGAVGLSALLMTSAWAFSVVKLIGAAYLVFMGVQMIRGSFRASTSGATAASQDSEPQALGGEPQALGQIFLQGALTNVLNPKVAIFFLAFLPQFIAPDAPSTTLAFVALGLIFDVVGTAWNILVACVAGRLAHSSNGQNVRIWLERVIGVLFVGIGAKLALSERFA
ncbi:MAG: LysE family translocator [Hyphomicrobiaceae bacterium]